MIITLHEIEIGADIHSFGVEQEVPKRTYRSTIHTSTHVGDPLQSLSSGIALWVSRDFIPTFRIQRSDTYQKL